MNRFKKQIITLCLLFSLLSVNSLASTTISVDMIGSVQPGIVTLKWIVQSWPDSLTGFMVKRRIVNSSNQAWKPITKSPICPYIATDKDWSLIDASLSGQVSLQKKTAMMIKKGRLQAISRQDFRIQLSQTDLMDLNNSIRNSSDLAFIMGFGIIDRSFDQPGHYEYGLFPVASTLPMDQPIQTFKCQITSIHSEFLKLYGVIYQPMVQLKWTIEDFWPEVVQGVVIQKRVAPTQDQPDIQWTRVTQKPIYPEASLTRDWANLGIQKTEQKRIETRLKELMSQGQIKSISNESFLSFAKQATLEELKGTNSLTAKHFDYALMIGFGCVDHDIDPKSLYEYGLFTIDNQHQLSSHPISKCIVRSYSSDDSSFKVSLLPEKARKGIIIRWSYPTVLFRERSLLGYHIYRSETKLDHQTPFHQLNQTPITTVTQENGQWQWHYIDRQVNQNIHYTYAVEPVDVFGHTYNKTYAAYGAKLNDQEIAEQLDHLSIQSISQANGYTIVVQWTCPSEMETFFKGFVIERVDLPDPSSKPISSLLQPGIRSYIDLEPKTHGNVYGYRVGCVGDKGIIRYSGIKTILFQNRLKLKPPKGFSAEYFEGMDGSAYARLTWQPYDDPIQLPFKGFVFFSDVVQSGNLVREASIPLTKETHYVYRLGERRGRIFQFGVAGKSQFGEVGEMAVATCTIPIKELPSVSKLSYLPIENGKQIELSWTYKMFDAIDEFIIRQTAQLKTNDTVVNKQDRKWVSPELEPNTLYTFQVIAKGAMVGESKYNKKVEYVFFKKSSEKLKSE